MKKILLIGLILGFCFAGNTNIRESMSKAYTSSGLEYYNMEVKGQSATTSNALVWYGDAIGGCSSIMALGMSVSAGTTPTTLSAQAVFADGTAIAAAQTITIGTSFTAINAPFYKFTLPVPTANRTVTFNFCIRN